MDFIDYIVFVCFTGAAISITLLIIGGLFELINYFSKGKFSDFIVNLFRKKYE